MRKQLKEIETDLDELTNLGIDLLKGSMISPDDIALKLATITLGIHRNIREIKKLNSFEVNIKVNHSEDGE